MIPLNVQMNVASATFDAKGAVSGSFLRDDAYWTKVPQAEPAKPCENYATKGKLKKYEKEIAPTLSPFCSVQAEWRLQRQRR
jgi:hypothetical protein